MRTPECFRYTATLNLIRQVIAAERASCDLHRYVTSFGGGQFDKIIDRHAADEFTAEDFKAVQKLNVSVLHAARRWLLGDGRAEVRELLRSIPADLDIWDVQPEDYDARLGPDSPAWQLWQLLFEKQKGARSAGRGVTAGKLLHDKRPRLIPIFDQARISKALAISHPDIWEAMWCALRDPEIRRRLQEIQASVADAQDLSVLRILDIVTWMSLEARGPTSPE